MSTVNLIGFPSHIVSALNGQSTASNQNQTNVRRPVYVSKSKGIVFIDEMHDHHIVNAFRRRLNDVIKEQTNHSNARTIQDVVDAFSTIRIFSLITSDTVLNDLHVEAQKRGMA